MLFDDEAGSKAALLRSIFNTIIWCWKKNKKHQHKTECQQKRLALCLVLCETALKNQAYYLSLFFYSTDALCTWIFPSNSTFILIWLNYSQKETKYTSIAQGNEAIIGKVKKATLTAFSFQSCIPSPSLRQHIFDKAW